MRATIKSGVGLGRRIEIAHIWAALKASWFTVLLVSSIVISAFALIYVKDLNRRLFIQSQTLQQDHQRMVNQWGKLLLEQSTWSAQSRVQSISEQSLGMVTPLAKDVVMLTNKE